ncbi:MAG: hypothetical protein V1662_03625 [Candidatus Omnitrophota bacterium]
MKKKKFKPEITKVELNPEQAVLACSCYDVGAILGANFNVGRNVCGLFRGKSHAWVSSYNTSSAAS